MVGQAWAVRACGGGIYLRFQRQKLCLNYVCLSHVEDLYIAPGTLRQ